MFRGIFKYSLYCLIKEGNILKYNVNKPKVISGSLDGEYLPIDDNKPTIDTATHRIAGSTYEVQADKVVKTYNVVEIPQEELMNKAKEEMMRAIETLIQSEVDKYNEANMVAFKDIDACAKYTTVTTYTHYQFCVDVIAWQTSVWEYARQVQADVMAGTRTMPTTEELLAELPVFGG